MIAKLIVHDQDRPRALARLREALAQCAIDGPKSNIAFLERLVRHPAIVGAKIDTGYLDRHPDEFMPGPGDGPAARIARLAAATVALLQDEATTRAAAAAGADPTSPWAIADGWRLGHAGLRRLVLGEGERLHTLVAHGHDGDYRIEDDEGAAQIQSARLADGMLVARFDEDALRFRASGDAGSVLLHDGDRRWRFARVPAYQPRLDAAGRGGDRVLAPMPGRIVLVKVAVGEAVLEGQEMLVMEAMKMELGLKAPRAGIISELCADAGDFVESEAILATLRTEE